MTINTQKFRGKEVTTVDGVLEAIYINEIPADKVKTYKGPNGPWTPTHRYNIVVDGTRISLGMGDKDGVSDKQQLRCKDNDDQYHTLARGMEVSVEVQENGEYKGVTQYQSSTGKLVITDTSNAQALQQASGNQGAGTKKSGDNAGVIQGHAMKGAGLLIANGVFKPEQVVQAATVFHDVTAEVKVWYEKFSKENSLGLDSYSIGNGAGNAVNTAAQYTKDVDKIAEVAIDLLENSLPQIAAHIKGGGVTKAVKTTKPAAKVTTRKAAVVEDELNAEDDFSDAPF